MSRYRRVNIDGRSLYKTETRVAAAALKPGTFAYIDPSDEFAVAPSVLRGRLYVIDVGYHEGLSIMDEIPSGHSAVGNYLEEGREFALRFAGGTELTKDQPITLGSNGYAVAGIEGEDTIIAYSQEEVSLPNGFDDFVRVRARYFSASEAEVTVTGVTVAPETDSIVVGNTTQLTATVAPPNASQAVAWTTSAAGVATVDNTGLVTGVSAGTATITATSVADGTKTDTATITVTAE